MKTMKRLLALLLALTMVMPNCLTIASAYDEEIVEEVAEELVEESVETPKEEEVFEEVFEEEIEEVFEEEIYEEETEEEPEEVVEEVVAASVTDDVAAVQVEPAQEIQVYIPEVPYDSEALFADHATSVLYPNGPVTMGTNGYDELDTQGQALYEALAAQFKQIADGDLQLTQVTVNLPFVVNIDQLSLVVDALLLDVPHNLYWYDKVSGVLLYTQTGTDGDYQQTIGFAVASAYADTSQITNVKLTVNGVEQERAYYFHTNTEKTRTAAETVRKAQAVATSEAFAAYKQKYGSCDTPYAKLKAYVEWICAAVDYDHDAANGNNNYFSATNCNPWQIIYVFDENSNTKVVCEGYSKALQYLCDIATDYEVPQVFSVCGDMFNISTNPVEGGRHMWNLAVMDGQNYLVDVTNIDGNWDTFLLGGTPANIVYNYTGGGYAYTAQKYTFGLSGGTVTYEYDQDTMTLYQWDLDEITLAEERYPQPGNTGSDADPATYQVDDANEMLNALEEAAEIGGTVVLNVDAQITETAGIGGLATLVVAEGVTLTIAKGVTFHVFGNVKVAGTIVNNGTINMMSGTLDVTGTYSGSGTVDNVHAEDLESVSGVRKSAMNIWVSAGTAEALFLGLNYADTYGMVDIRLNGDVTVRGDVPISENVNLYVNPGITLTVAEGFSVQNNGRIINNGGTIVGTIKGNPPETVEIGGDPYLSTYWVHNEGEGAFVNHSYPENREFRMVPGENFQWIFYFNQWNETTQTWTRTPVDPVNLECGPNVKMTLGKDIEWIAQARGDNSHLEDYFVGIEVTGGWDTDSYVRYNYSENSYVDYPIHICRDSNRGFYSSAEVADNSTWLYEIQDGPAKENHTFYFHYNGENTLYNVKLAAEDTFATMEKVADKDNVWAITLSEDYVNSLWNHRAQRDDRLKVVYIEYDGQSNSSNSADIGIQSYWADMEAGFTFIDKQDVFEGYNYDAETNSWIDIHENGWSLTELPNGITYDYATNTLTLNNVQLNGMHLHYRDDQGNKLLPNPNLTIKLDGTSDIGNPGFGAAVAIGSGLKVAILDGEEAGTGVLNLRCEDASKHIGAIDLAADSQLTIAGGTVNAINADMDWKGEVTITGGTVTGDYTGILAKNLLKMTGGTIHLTNSSGLSLQAMAEIRNATLDLDNSVMRTMVGTQIHNSTINIDVDEQNTVLGTDDFALWNNGYLAINNGTNLTVKATGFAGKEFYAVKNTGTYHQMGGNVTVTSDASAAGNITATIPAMLTSGTALLNEGTLTLNGQVGYEQYYDENWGGQGEQLLEVAGGILNANGTDAGMLIQGHAAWKGGTVNAYAKSVPIHAGTAPYDPMPQAVRLEQRLVDGVNHASLHIAGGNHNLTAEQDPTVPQGNAAIGLYINNAPVGYEAGTVNLYAGLAMCSITSAADLSNFENLEDMKFVSGEEVLTLTTTQWSNNRWNQGLVNAAGEPAKQATISLTDDVVTIETQADFQQAMEAAIAEGKQSFELTGIVTITENLDLPIAVRVMAGAELTVADSAVLTIQNEKNLTAEYGSITVEAGGRIENNQSQLTNMGGTITINHKEGYAGYVEENGTMMMRSISTPNGLSIGTTTGWPYSKQALGVTCERLDQISWAIGQAKNLGFRNTEIDIWNSVELTYNLTIPENVSVIINSPRADGGSNEIQPVSMLMVPEGKTLTINAATTEGAVNGSLFMNNGSVLQVDSGATVTNHGYLHIGDWQDGTHEFSGIMNVDEGATVNLYGYTAVHHYNAGSEEQPDYIPAVMNVDGVVNTFRVGDDDGGFLDNNGIVNIAGTVNSGFLFHTSGETNILAGGELNVEDVLANYDTIYINSGAALIVNGTMAPYGTVINNGGSISGDGSFGGTCGAGLNWKLSGSTLTISGEGAMASAPWNDLAFIGNVETVKLTSKLTNIVEGAFAQCKSGVSIVIPRAVKSIGNNAFAANANLKVYHNSDAEALLESGFDYIHEINTDDGSCMVEDCEYNIKTMIAEAESVQEKVDAVTSFDTTTLKKQIQDELNKENSNGTSDIMDIIKDVEEQMMAVAEEEEKNLSVGVQSDSSAIGEVSDDAIVGALLSASEDAEQVTLVVTDAEDIPAVDPELAHKYSSNGAVHFEMTLEGVDDPENLTAPVTVTLPIPEELLDKKIVVVHYGFNGTEVIEPWVDPEKGTATFAVDGFSTFAYSTAPVAYVDEPTNTYGDLQTAIDEAKNGSTVTLLAKYEGMRVNVNKVINIDPNGYDLPDSAILVAEGFKKIVENGVYRISAIKQLNSEGIQLKTGLIYNGQEQTVLEQITDGETVLEEGVDYTVTGNKATNAGTYTMTVVGSGDYSGELSFTWSIAKAKISIQVNHEIQVMTPATENNRISIPLSACQISVEGGNYSNDQLSKLFAEIHPTWSGDTTVLGAVHDVNPDSYVKSDNYNVELSGTVTIILGDYVCWNPTTGEYWTDLSDALEAVDDAAEETIEMLKNVKEDYVIIAPGTTLDLNGLTVEGYLVSGFKQSHVIDSSKNNAGLLMADMPANVRLDTNNEQIPAWNGAGYKFYTVNFNTRKTNPDSTDIDLFQFYMFRTDDWRELYTLFTDHGSDDLDLKLYVKLSYVTSDGIDAAVSYKYPETMTSKAASIQLGSETKVGIYKATTKGMNSRERITYSVVLVSGTGAEVEVVHAG